MKIAISKLLSELFHSIVSLLSNLVSNAIIIKCGNKYRKKENKLYINNEYYNCFRNCKT